MAALARLTPEELAALQARIEASGGVLPFTRPVPGRISLRYGTIDREHGNGHSGTDLAGSCGTPIVASAAGTVIQAGRYGWEGNYVAIDHGRSAAGHYYRTSYAHMLDNSIQVTPGEFVERGQMIGRVGNTGYSFGCHVHWMVWEDGQLRDGYYFLQEGMLETLANQ
jgi:murein DD-endopeptidase MepM/ murein hydrolase activator NlpD